MASVVTSNQSNLPSAFETYYISGSGENLGLIPQAFNVYGTGDAASYSKKFAEPLQAAGLYGAGRVAGLSPSQLNLGSQIKGMGTPSQFAMGTGALGSGYEALTGLPSMLTPGQMQQYMSPYTQNVVDVQKREAIRDAEKTQLAQNLGAARQGTYGGARQLLAGTERERALGQQLGDIQARGLQSAYEAAQKGLEAERAAQIQQGVGLGNLGQQFGQLGIGQQTADLDRLKTLGAFGDLERAYSQQQIDARYADLMQGIQYPESQLEKMSNFLRGIPTDKTTTTTTPPPSFASQLAGLGLSGLSLYNLFNKA